MSVSTIKLIMPKFKIEALVELQDVFKKMGNETNKKINERFKNDCYNTFIFANRFRIGFGFFFAIYLLPGSKNYIV